VRGDRGAKLEIPPDNLGKVKSSTVLCIYLDMVLRSWRSCWRPPFTFPSLFQIWRQSLLIDLGEHFNGLALMLVIAAE
jgi:hypothetical protein